ncbi:hypothetical protein [Thiocapsa bogorovii]|uniref:hypothetical protein n=1 Tax=Thiocapsa bogorovii TaxID=521689 RepID=UPI001E364916|nr:hypothetical protein [Thiocapsa bogorovii]UHD15727.1 hypothetical protein LT988_21100 [Thiocapsa bogorovii]
MRKDAHIEPARWIREYRAALRLSDVAFKVLLYCECGPESHRTGIHFVASGTIAEIIFEDRETVDDAFDDLEAVGLLLRDSAAGLVYLPNQCAAQFAWKKGEPKAEDYRLVEAKRHIASLPESPLVRMFLDRWPIFRSDEAPTQAPCQAPTEAPSVAPCQAPTQGTPQGTTTSTVARRVGNPPDGPDGGKLVEIRLGGAA